MTLNFYITLETSGHHLDKSFCKLFPPPAKSHYMLGNELGRALADAGHEVTMISAFTDPKPPKNYKEILVPEFLKLRDEKHKEVSFNMYEMENINPIYQIIFLNFIGEMFCSTFFEHPKIEALLKSNQHFDAVILEQFWNDAAKIFAYHFKAHLILFSTMGPNRWVNNLVANPEPPSYVPDILLDSTGSMSFFERICNLLFGFISDLDLYLFFYPRQNTLMKKYYPNAPHLDELQYNISLILTNSHESVNQPVPHVPNMIDIGGFHVNPPKELSKDLKEFMDNATDGVIYFSMGSNLIPSEMPIEKRKIIIKVLGSRKEKVLWKWDDNILENKPDNMMISEWFPQQDILAHPNCKLFVTHGGLLSTIETVYLGVPVLAMPIFGDQKLNAARAVSLGYGKSLPFSKINENNFAEVLDELLKNPSYRENAKMRSKIMHDRPIKPIDLAIYWIEYVVRHNGAPHLRVAGIKLPLYKYYMLDIIGVVLGGFTFIVYLLRKLCRCIRCNKSTPKETQEKNKPKKKRE